MPILIGLLVVAGTAYLWMSRIRNAAEITRDLSDMAGNLSGAARRFGFKRRADRHPVDTLEDPIPALAGTALAFTEISGLPSTEQLTALTQALQGHLRLSRRDAEEALILGRWLMNQCGGASAGVSRLSRRLYKLDPGSFTTLMAVINETAQAGSATLSPLQQDTLGDIARLFRIK